MVFSLIILDLEKPLWQLGVLWSGVAWHGLLPCDAIIIPFKI